MLPSSKSACSGSSSKGKRKYVRKLSRAIGMNYVGEKAFQLPPSRCCRHCGATLLAFESTRFCCLEGEVSIAPVIISGLVHDLFTRTDAYGEHFNKLSRVYNNFFAFSSLGGGLESSTRNGIHTLHVHGQLYHFLPNLVAASGSPNYLQMYFYDGALELDSRMRGFGTLCPEIVQMLMNLMATNPYARFFRSLSTFQKPEDFTIKLKTNPVLDQRVYNAPTTEEVACIFVDDGSASAIRSPDIIVHAHGDHCHRVMHFYGCYDPLQYPLLFCNGESGWHQGISRSNVRGVQHTEDNAFPISTCTVQDASDLIALENTVLRKRSREDKTISCREYYSFRFQIRPHMSVVNMRRIFLQYITDMYIKIESTRLDFIRYNQNTLRSELYQGVVDSVNDGVRSSSSIGKRVILPASFIGGPRDMKRRYLNAMALVQKFGKPDLFITMTCNPAWPEIIELLNPGETSQDRPDIIARVFRAKIVHLKELILKQKVFGEVCAHADVVEFQKRGLPHLHMLVILASNDKIRNPDCYDQYVSAELPPKENSILRSRVVQHMIHGPCGELNPTCPCMKEKDSKWKCRFDYPKDYAEFSTCAVNSYPIYKRRDNGDHIKVRGNFLDNRWVIPYNPFLLVEFDCHINVEICSTVKAIKYIYKYIYKGHDRVCFDLERNHVNMVSEPDAFQSARWVSPPEAAHRIFGFDLYDMQPPVFPLQVHLPNKHNVLLHCNTNLQALVNGHSMETTMLTAYFEENRSEERTGDYLYREFPEHYIWDNKSKSWRPRKNKRWSIGRMIFVSPAEGERYFLRLLLCNVRCATSFADLMTVGRVQLSTFKESCERRGYIENYAYADACMEEAIQVQMPAALRRLFAILLIFGDGVDPLTLWTKYLPHLSEDFSRLHPKDMSKVTSLTFREVEKKLESMGKNMQDYNIPDPNSSMDSNIKITRDIVDALSAPIPSIYVNASTKLNHMQRCAYDGIMDAALQNKGGAFFVDGPGGTGKTFLYCVLYTELRILGKIVIPTATSGIAASNIPSGRTAHSRFKIPIDSEGSFSCSVSKQSSLAALLCSASLFIWDEASMAKKEDIEAFDLLLRDICDTQTPFGGKVVVFRGDFRQVLPVLPHKSQNEAVKASLVNSYLWPCLQKYQLSENMRAREDPSFSDFLLNLGNGALQAEEKATISLPPEMFTCLDIRTPYTEQLVNAIFPEMRSHLFDSQIFSDRAILTPTNECVDDLNEQLIACFSGVSVTYTGTDTLIDENHNLCTPEFLNTLCPPGMSPYELNLKKGCPVILVRNLDPSHGLCNGTRLICKEFHNNIITCEISSGYCKGERVFLPRINLRPPPSMKFPFAFQRKQFPIKLCFAMTINKAQGQTLQKVCIFLQKPCFSHGQLYVAFSRARKRGDLIVFLRPTADPPSITHDVINVVSYTILNKAGIL